MIKAKFEKESYATKGGRAKVKTDIEMKVTLGVVRDELIKGIIKMIRAFFREKDLKKESCMEFVRLLTDVLEEEFLKEGKKNNSKKGWSYASKSIYNDMFDSNSNSGSCNIYDKSCK